MLTFINPEVWKFILIRPVNRQKSILNGNSGSPDCQCQVIIGDSAEKMRKFSVQCGKNAVFMGIVRKKCGKCPYSLTGCLNLTFIVKLFFGECVINYVFL